MNQKINCIITDDEPYARKGLLKYAEQVDFLVVKEHCEDALQLNDAIKQHGVELLFLDINMPHMSGIDFLKSLTKPPKVIFTTAYEQYAIDGYDLDIVDFLLKPISFERFLKACNKAYDLIVNQKGLISVDKAYFFIKSEGKIERINLDDILYLESMQNYVIVHTVNNQYITHLTLKTAMEYLDPGMFIQPHKSYYVAIDKIQSIDGGRMKIEQKEVPISKHLKAAVMERILNDRFLKR